MAHVSSMPWLGRVPAWLAPLANGTSSYWLYFAACFVILGAYTLPVGWSGNEQHYYGLGLRLIAPELFTENHATFDGLKSRSAALYLIGGVIKLTGLEAARIVLGVANWIALSAAFAFMARSTKVTVTTVVLGLWLFFEFNQTMFADEWMFKTVEAKTFAYLGVFLGIAFAFQDRRTLAFICMALGTYAHFLVGGFWGLAVLWIIWCRTQSGVEVARSFALFFLLILPLGIMLLYERYGGAPLDMTGLSLTLNEIYAEYRVPHHVAPFYDMDKFYAKWWPGLVWTCGYCVALALAVWLTPRGQRGLASWTLGLNIYLLVAFAIAYLDRGSHHFATLYIFRPASLTLVLTWMVLFQTIQHRLPSIGRLAVSALCIVLFAIISVPKTGAKIHDAISNNRTLAQELDPAQVEFVNWVTSSTAQDEVLVFAPWPRELIRRHNITWTGMELITGRPMLVLYKFLPATPDGIIKWYRMLQWQDAIFTEGCAQLGTFPADYFVLRGQKGPGALGDCTTTVWTNAEFVVLKPTR